jgi:CRP/FNR family transcriptional regulator
MTGSIKITDLPGSTELHGAPTPKSIAHCVLSTLADCKSGDRQVKAGQDLFRTDGPCDAIYSLVDGWMFRYRLLADGRRQIFDFVLPGAVLGFHPEGGPMMTYSVQALTDAVAWILPRKALGMHPELGFGLASLVARDRDLAFDHLTSIGRQSARERVAHLILELFVRCRAQWPGHRIEAMHLPLTQEHIADATGLTGVHVNRVLSSLRKSNILTFSYRRLAILDPDRLVDLAGVEPELLRAWTEQEAPMPGARHEPCRRSA